MTPIQLELPTIFEDMTVNSWLFKDPVPTLVDCGEKTEKSWNALEKGLRENGLEVRDIQRIVITHAHLDHIGMANQIVQHSDATVYVNELCLDWAINLKKTVDLRTEAIMGVVTQTYPTEIVDKFFGFGYEILSPYWDEIPADRVETFPLQGTIDLGGEPWEILYTPGHCINQTCFFHPPSGHLLSADMVMKFIPNPIIDAGLPAGAPRTKSLVSQMESYHKLAKLPITRAFPGHFKAFGQVPLVIERQIEKVNHRTQKCHQLIRNGCGDAYELAKAIYPGRIHNATLFMVIGFLDILLDRGLVWSEMREGRRFFFPKEGAVIKKNAKFEDSNH